MGDLKSIDSSNFTAEVLEAQGPVLVDFWGEGCRPCQRMGLVLDELALEVSEQLTIVKANVRKDYQLAEKNGVVSIPTLVLFKNGEEVHRMVGFKAKDRLKKELLKYL